MIRKLKKGPVPLYYQLERALRKRILTGKIIPSSQFPTERQLGEEFGVSRITVRQALMILENEGLLRREQGRGTFVIKRDGGRIPYDLYGYVDDLFFLGAQSRLKLNGKKLIKVDSRVASDMNMEEGEEVYLFDGIRLFNGNHTAFFQAYLPKRVGGKIPLKELSTPFLIAAVERISLEMVKKAHQTITAAVATRRLASVMKLQVGHPLLVIKRIYFSKKGNVLEMAVTHFPGDRYQSVAKLERIVS
ncbi:MAG: GntR family transcriptional regulator [Thermodesulfobacteriota bacterium]|jgi:GntR family transcriptional regulator